jgi:hypothetical protein
LGQETARLQRMFLSRGTYKWTDFGDRHVYLQVSKVKAQTKMGSFRLAASWLRS